MCVRACFCAGVDCAMAKQLLSRNAGKEKLHPQPHAPRSCSGRAKRSMQPWPALLVQHEIDIHSHTETKDKLNLNHYQYADIDTSPEGAKRCMDESTHSRIKYRQGNTHQTRMIRRDVEGTRMHAWTNVASHVFRTRVPAVVAPMCASYGSCPVSSTLLNISERYQPAQLTPHVQQKNSIIE